MFGDMGDLQGFDRGLAIRVASFHATVAGLLCATPPSMYLLPFRRTLLKYVGAADVQEQASWIWSLALYKSLGFIS
jgi:hypothetical protein